MEYNQDTGLASVSGTAVTGWRCRMYLSASVTRVVGRGGLARVNGVRAFSSTVTYRPFSRDYIQSSDLTRKRRLGSRQGLGGRVCGRLSARRISCQVKRILPIFPLAKISSPV